LGLVTAKRFIEMIVITTVPTTTIRIVVLLIKHGMQIDAHGIHSFICKRAPGRTARHQALNELIARAFASADIPVI